MAELAALLERMDSSLYDVLELRLDACADLDPAALAGLALPLPAIFTLRCKEEGGLYPLGEEERLDMLAALMRLKPAYLDMEASVAPERAAYIRSLSPDTRIILSQHDFNRTPVALRSILDSMMQKLDGAVYKIATYAQSGLDALRMLVFCKEQKARGVPLIGICMGEDGVSTRVLAPVVHTGFCYCPVDEPSAPGQLDAATLRGVYNFAGLGADTAVYGLLGDPVGQSVGHVYHNERNAATACNAVYVKWRVTAEETRQALALLRALGVAGLSVTMPLKEAVMPFLADIDGTGRAVGAVNTLKSGPGGFIATNTDGAGALDSVGEVRSWRGKTVVVLGAGGAAKAVIHEADRRGAVLAVYNRTPGKKLPVAAGLATRAFSNLGELRARPYDIIINALPFGVSLAFEEIPFQAGTLALDLSYGKPSAFLRAAGAAGCRIMDGAGMFAGQAGLQRIFWNLPV
jgi:3-dehydroquinate dehydratase/shikimate dehydrogenase